MKEDLAGLVTEMVNEETKNIDRCSTLEMVEQINRQDAQVAGAVAAEKERIAQAVDLISGCLGRGGRLIYLGAGTSGRLGVLDASECPPTFGVEPELATTVTRTASCPWVKAACSERNRFFMMVSPLKYECLMAVLYLFYQFIWGMPSYLACVYVLVNRQF